MQGIIETEEKCKQMVRGAGKWGGFHKHQCRSKIWKDGYCKKHHPEIVSARRAVLDKIADERFEAKHYCKWTSLGGSSDQYTISCWYKTIVGYDFRYCPYCGKQIKKG